MMGSVEYLIKQIHGPVTNWANWVIQHPPSIKTTMKFFQTYYEANRLINCWNLNWVILTCVYIQCSTKGLDKKEIDRLLIKLRSRMIGGHGH